MFDFTFVINKLIIDLIVFLIRAQIGGHNINPNINQVTI